MGRLASSLLVCLLVPAAAQAQPACEALFADAKQALAAFQPRAADSLATARVRVDLRRARTCYARQPVLDSTGANHFAQLWGREVQVLWETRRADEAAALTEAFLDGPHRRADSSGVRYLLEWRGFILEHRGQFEAAARSQVQLLDYAPSATPAVRTRIWLSLGANYSWLGWWDDALAIYESVQRELGDETDHEPDLRVSLARAYDKEAEVRLHQLHLPGNRARSLAAAREATRLLHLGESSREQHFRVFANITLSKALDADGQPEAALAAAQAAAALAARLERPTPSAEIASRDQVGRMLMTLERYAEAQSAFEHVLRLHERSEERGFRHFTLDGLLLATMHLGDYARADSLSEQVLHAVEAERMSAGPDMGVGRASFWYPHYLSRVELLLRQGRHEEAFLTLDAARARVLRDLRHRRFGTRSPETQPVADSLAALLADLHGALTRPGLSPEEVARLRSRVNEVERARTALYGERTAGDDITVGRLQAALARRDQVLLTYYLEAPARAFVLRPDTLIVAPLDPALDAARIRELMQAVSPQWNQASGPISFAKASFELAPLKTLYDLLFEPVAPHIPEGASLVVVPEGPLAQLPFGLLIADAPNRFQFDAASFLMRRHAVSAELAAALLLDDLPTAEASTVDPADARLVAFGRSAFGDVESDILLRSGFASAVPPDLPNVVREIENLDRRFPDAHTALDEAATESRFYELAGGAELLHLASHAFVAESDPMSSYIQLAPDSTEDGRLYLYELLARPLDAALVVLSGCRTARGRDRGGEGALGLHYAVRAAGAASSLGTLWHVDDASTVELMDRFYAYLAQGERKDVALQKAQLDYLNTRDGLRASPFFWAAPVLYGDPRPVPLPRSTAPWWWIGAALVLAGLALPRFIRRSRTT